MYEPIRAKSVHSMTGARIPQRSREEELDIRLAGHLTALLTLTDELRALRPDPSLDDAAHRLAVQAARLRGGVAPLRAAPSAAAADDAHVAALHARAHRLAGNAQAIAASREDRAAGELAEERAEAHAAGLPDLDRVG